ncbi:MAG: hypothetical protein GX858_00930 [Clostridiales bacterium]|nr:hypothetical protein [Clostridiales bacterium]
MLVVLSLAVGTGYSGLAGYKVFTRVYQHRSWMQPSNLPESSDEELVTHLPIITINTNGQDVPGERMGDGEDNTRQYSLAQDGDTRIVTKFAMYDSGAANKLSDTPAVTSLARIRYRGNYSRRYHKKSFSVSLVMPDGVSDNLQSLAGLASHNEWVLDGLWIDRTQLRNYLAYNVAGEVMGYAPNVRFVEMILNDEYQGVYLLVEPVTRGKGRLDLRKTEAGKDITSFIVRWDRANKGDQKLNNFTFYTYRSDLSALDVRYPGKQNFTPGRMNYIEQSVSKIEKTLYSADLSDPRDGYRKYLDLDSFAHYFILNEFFRNTDAGRYSTFLYKDMRG